MSRRREDVSSAGEEWKVRAEGEQRGSRRSRGRFFTVSARPTAFKPLRTIETTLELWLGCVELACLAYLSTAPERDCHLILPCGPLSWCSHGAEDWDSSNAPSSLPLSCPGGHALPYTSWKMSAQYSALETLPLNMNSLNNKFKFSETASLGDTKKSWSELETKSSKLCFSWFASIQFTWQHTMGS